MNDSHAPNSSPSTEDEPAPPTFAELAADPEIAALLDFTPVPRKIDVPDGWSPENQREFIARLAVHGSACKACDEMGKHRTGVTKLFNHPQGASFRAAWKGAVALALRRRKERAPPQFVRPGEKPPTVDHRFKWASSSAGGGYAPSPFEDEGGYAPSPGSPWASPPSPAGGEGLDEELSPGTADELADALRRKFVIKLRQEREARLSGRIAEADFYLRQISFFEVALELLSVGAIDALAKLRRDDVSLLNIADTEATRMLDRARRKAWIDLTLERMAPRGGQSVSPAEGDSGGEGDDQYEDLDIFPAHLLDDHDGPPGQGFRTEPLPFAPYNCPAEGYDWAQWGELGDDDRARAYAAQFARAAAEEQVKWEQEMIAIAVETAAREGLPLPLARPVRESEA